MGGVTREGPPFPSRLLSKHIPSAKKTPIRSIYTVDQSVTARYNFVVELGLPVSPLQGGPALLLPAPGPMRQGVSYVGRANLYIRNILPSGGSCPSAVLADRSGAMLNFAFTEFYEVRELGFLGSSAKKATKN